MVWCKLTYVCCQSMDHHLIGVKWLTQPCWSRHITAVYYFIFYPLDSCTIYQPRPTTTNPADTTGMAASLLLVCESLLASAHSQGQHLAPRGTYQHTANPFSMCCPLTWIYHHTATWQQLLTHLGQIAVPTFCHPTVKCRCATYSVPLHITEHLQLWLQWSISIPNRRNVIVLGSHLLYVGWLPDISLGLH